MGAFQAQIRTLANSHGILRAKGRVQLKAGAAFCCSTVGQRVDGCSAYSLRRLASSNAGRLAYWPADGAAAIASQLGGGDQDSGSDAS